MFGRTRLLLGIAAKHLAVRKRQTVVAVSGVGVGVGFFLAVSALMIGSQNDFVRTLIDAAPHIIVSDEIRSPPPQPAVTAFGEAAVQVRGYKPRNEVRGLKDWQRILQAADSIPGGVGSPSLSGAITLRVGGREEALGIIGIDPAIEQRVSTVEDNLSAGRLRDLETTSGGIIIGEQMAERLGVGIGDTVGATSRTGTRSLRIVGLFERGRGQLGASNGYVLLREAQSLTGQPFIINRIGVKLADPYAADAVAADLERRFGYKAESWQERSADFLTLLLTRNIIMYTVVSAILLVASFGIYTVVSNSVADKRRDIAIMRSIGFSEGDLQRIFVTEGIVLALVGILFGWALGLLLMQILGSLEFTVQGKTEHIPLDRRPRQFLIAGGASLFSAVIAAWLPARKAARVDPVDILRGAA
ncbi:MAG: ABC transporter permease [Allosphingosinicella sp.]|uniref:ABC transporter permease n=1 Tax=Allosphingosinicella sp. TaxID=2823234 RepID=UPI00393400C6